MRHPSENLEEARLVRDLGEAEYMRRVLPAMDTPSRAALLIPLAALPLVYYIVSYQAHDPALLARMLLLLAAYEAQSWIFRTQNPRGTRS